ncbi:hypothetical protein B6D48_23910, partial [Salmonella enterica subsp. enterica serovar Paratyphi B]
MVKGANPLSIFGNESSTNSPGIDRNISGKVTDEKGEPLPGVSVVLKGSKTGTATNTEGTYTLSIPDDNAVLIFSYVGYTPEEVT